MTGWTNEFLNQSVKSLHSFRCVTSRIRSIAFISEYHGMSPFHAIHKFPSHPHSNLSSALFDRSNSIIRKNVLSLLREMRDMTWTLRPVYWMIACFGSKHAIEAFRNSVLWLSVFTFWLAYLIVTSSLSLFLFWRKCVSVYDIVILLGSLCTLKVSPWYNTWHSGAIGIYGLLKCNSFKQ